MTNAQYISYWSSTKVITFSKINNTALKFHNIKTTNFRPLYIYLNTTKHIHVSLSNLSNVSRLPSFQINTSELIKNHLILSIRSTLICWIKILEFNFTTLYFLFKILTNKFIKQSTANNTKKKLNNLTLLHMNAKYI